MLTLEVVAAMPARRQPQYRQSSQQGHPKGQQGQQAASGKVSKGTGLCWKHQRYGKDTLNCVDKKNCTWSGN